MIVVRSSQVPQDRLQGRELGLEGFRETELGNLNIRHSREQILGDLAQELADTCWCIVKPVRTWIGCWADREAVWRSLCGGSTLWEARVGRVANAVIEVFDAGGEVGGVRVNGEEVAGTLDQVLFFFGQGRKNVAESVFEDLWVVAVIPLTSDRQHSFPPPMGVIRSTHTGP